MGAMSLEVETDNGCMLITLRRVERRNALDGPTWSALRTVAEETIAKPPRAVIITGAAGHFSAGMDLGVDNPMLESWLPAMQSRDESALEMIIRDLKAATDAIAGIPCPVVAAIEGACAGGGLEIALACDLRIAAKSAYFKLPETKLGMIPDVGGTVRAVRLIGRSRASDLILSARRVAADEALAWGLISRICADGEALAVAKRAAGEILENGPIATREVLQVLRRANDLTDREAFDLETRAGVRALLSGECVEGMQAFLEKRPAKWRSA
jgi:enoyl-CoA hydratase